MSMRFITIQPEQQQTLKDQHEAWQQLAERLELVGGTALVIPLWSDPHVEHLAVHGVEFNPDRVVMKIMRRSGCHSNVSRLYLDGEVAAIATGYGLSEDGYWRQHTWGVGHDDGRAADDGDVIVETTVPRIGYLGFRIAPEMAQRWARVQLTETL